MKTFFYYIAVVFIAFINLNVIIVEDTHTYSGKSLPLVEITAKDHYFRTKNGNFPKEIFHSVKVDSAIQWNDTILLACLINTELQSGSFFEKKMIAQTVVDRANTNFNKFGNSIAEQVFAPAQFSGVVKRTNSSRWCYYFDNDKSKQNNPKVANRFNYNPFNTQKVTIKRSGLLVQLSYQDIAFENYQAAKEVLEGKRPIPQTVLYFCNPTISTDKGQVAKVIKKQIYLPQPTKHIFSGNL
jgi:hypothetical protein